MKVSEILGNMINWHEGLSVTAAQQKPSQEYANAPHEVTQSMSTIIAQGDDVNKPKHPSDIRTNAVSMYPNSQAKG